MQKVVYVIGNELKEINKLLAEGWKVVNFQAVNGSGKTWDSYAYFLLEK